MVLVFEQDSFQIYWNESATFNVFYDGVEVDVFTCYDVEGGNDAAEVAEAHFKQDIMGYE